MGVPFVDCLTTMLDESIPLTVMEYEVRLGPASDSAHRRPSQRRDVRQPGACSRVALRDPKRASALSLPMCWTWIALLSSCDGLVVQEWGNPADKAIYECMLSYSPIDNVRQQAR